MPNILLYATSIAPFYFRAGDHWVFIVHFPMEILFGDEFVSIARPEIRRLISKQPSSVEKYLQKEEALFTHHKMKRKVSQLIEN